MKKKYNLTKKCKQLAIDKEAIEFAKKRSKDLGVGEPSLKEGLK